MKQLNALFEAIVEIPGIMVGKRQIIELSTSYYKMVMKLVKEG